MIRFFDFWLAFLGLLFLSPLLLLILLAGWLETRSPLFIQKRIGIHQEPFMLVKFRTMKRSTASVPTHLVDSASLTKLGSFLRKTKLDELPQLWNVLCGDMSLVGPRPCLPEQNELIKERAALRVFDKAPGITGLAQINKIDMSTPQLLAKTDARMLQNLNFRSYLTYIFLTILGKGSGDRVNNKTI